MAQVNKKENVTAGWHQRESDSTAQPCLPVGGALGIAILSVLEGVANYFLLNCCVLRFGTSLKVNGEI